MGNCLTVNMRLELELPALPECVRRAREAITELSEKLQLELDVVERIRIAVTEACTNCVQHAYPDDHPNPTYMLEASLQAGALVIVVHDCGVGYVPGQRSAHAGLGPYRQARRQRWNLIPHGPRHARRDAIRSA
ncbi:MAG TPA: ATP-binding protein [Gaiellales bacterium]|nr:ATP-binding protein [Gaiellales bacterium]